jgi:hypothetical protein
MIPGSEKSALERSNPRVIEATDASRPDAVTG